MRSLATSAFCLSLIVAVGGVGCKKKSHESPGVKSEDNQSDRKADERAVRPETLVLTQVLLEKIDPDQVLSLQDGDLARDFGAMLVSPGLLVGLVEHVDESHRARRVEAVLSVVTSLQMPSASQAGSVAVAVQASLRYLASEPGDREPHAAILVEQSLRTGDAEELQGLSDKVVRSALVSAGESLLVRVRLQSASDAELLAALAVTSEDASLIAWALELAAQRALSEAVPHAIRALSHPDEDVRAAAISALVELRDPRAVTALIHNVDFKDYESLRVVMEAVSVIGGEEALEFLEFVKSGHEAPDIRLHAQECIGEMRARARESLP